MKRKFVIIFVLVTVLFFAILGIVMLKFSGKGFSSKDKQIALVYISGAITDGEKSVLSGGGGASEVVAQLEEIKDDPKIAAVVLRVNSPGGSVGASQEIYKEVKKLRGSGKKVVVSMGDVAASGGYYISAAADRIVANPGTLTGSIGVIMELQNYHGLFRKLGVDVNVVKSGKFKDIGNPNRELTSEERDLLQGIINDTYEDFVYAVAEGRRLKIEEVRKIADGRVFTGNQAKKLKLIDTLGNLPDAIDLAAKLAGIKGEPEIVSTNKPSFLRKILGSDARLLTPGNSQSELGLLKQFLESGAAGNEKISIKY